MPWGVSSPAAILIVVPVLKAVPPSVNAIEKPPFTDVVVDAKATVPAVRCAAAKAVTSTVWVPAEAVLLAVAAKAVVLVLLTTMLL